MFVCFFMYACLCVCVCAKYATHSEFEANLYAPWSVSSVSYFKYETYNSYIVKPPKKVTKTSNFLCRSMRACKYAFFMFICQEIINFSVRRFGTFTKVRVLVIALLTHLYLKWLPLMFVSVYECNCHSSVRLSISKRGKER